MDEMNSILPPDLVLSLDQYYTARQPDAAFSSHLAAQLRHRQIELLSPNQKPHSARYSKRNIFMQKIRTRPIRVALLSILALLALTGVVYAIGRLTGFIPGFGFTSESNSVFVLAEPVEMTSGGITLHVDQAVNDGEQFWVQITVAGLPEEWKDFSNAFVLLPDGNKIQYTIGGSSNAVDGGISLSYLFPPLAGQPQELSLLVDGLGGQDFDLPLKMRPIKAGEIVAAPPEGNVQLQSETHDGVCLVLDHVAMDSKKTVFQVSLRFDQPNTWVVGPWNVTLSDEAGALYPLTDVTPDTMTGGDTHVYQTVPFTGTEQLTLSLVVFPNQGVLPMFQDFSGEGLGFTFDPGISPQTGQTWELDETIRVGQFTLHVVRAALTAEPGLIFEFEPAEGITGAMVYTNDPLLRGSTGGVPVQEGNFTAGMTFESIPSQPFEVVVSRVYYSARGTWQIQWQPPAAPTPAAGLPTPTTSATLAAFATPTLASSDPLVLEIQQLAQKFDAPFQQGPGWVHIVNETISNPQSGQMYPLPYLKSELWYEIDAEGYVTRHVWLDYDSAGTLIQQTATVGDYSINFTTGDSGFNQGVRYRLSFDTLTQSISHAAQNNTRVLREEIPCDDGRAPCLLITGHESFASPVQNPGEPQAFSGSGRRVWIDLQTGQQVKSQSFWLLEDGSEKVTSTQSTILVEKQDAPPQEILDILSRVIVP